MTEIETAKAFIRAQLAEGPMLRRDIEAAARDAGIADRTLRRARETMNVVVSKQNGAMTGPWLWALPEREFDGPSTKGRSRVWAVREAIASKNARREKPVPVPGDLGNQWTASYGPYYFVDFAWRASLVRRDELVARDDENRRQLVLSSRKAKAMILEPPAVCITCPSKEVADNIALLNT